MIRYADLDPRKEAFIFELDNVLYPAKDYYYQVFYLFGALIEYSLLIDAKEATNLMIDAYLAHGIDEVFDNLKKSINLEEKFRDNFNLLSNTAKLPLKLLLYQDMLKLLQDIVVDRKKIFIVTNGNPIRQLNKIKQTEWHGLEPYLTCYFANETAPKPETDSIDTLIMDHGLQRRAILMIGNSETDEQCAQSSGIDFMVANQF
jgi:FMN phosphatase YigB (HAD superfamily)